MDRRARLASLTASDGAWVPPEPRLAATMILMRGGKVLVLRRSDSMAFAPGMHVFPGGGLDPQDRLHPDPLLACAVRETMEEVAIQVDDCRLIDRWITPEVEERRYDVFFFLATTAQHGRLTTTEADLMRWLAPGEALRLHARGELPMLRPTVTMLRGLEEGAFDTVREIRPKLPRLRADGRWDVVDASNGTVLESDVRGPAQAETDGAELL